MTDALKPFVVTFWRSASETELPIYVITVSDYDDIHALSQSVRSFASQGWDGPVDHVTIRRQTCNPIASR